MLECKVMGSRYLVQDHSPRQALFHTLSRVPSLAKIENKEEVAYGLPLHELYEASAKHEP